MIALRIIRPASSVAMFGLSIVLLAGIPVLLVYLADRYGWSLPAVFIVLASLAGTALGVGAFFLCVRALERGLARRGIRQVMVFVEEGDRTGSVEAFDAAWQRVVRLHDALPIPTVRDMLQRVGERHPDIQQALERSPPDCSPEKKVTILRRDTAFGEMCYHTDVLYWQARVPFAPLGRDVVVDVGNDGAGLVRRQRSWFEELERRYDSLRPGIDRLLQSNGSSAETLHLLELVRVNFPDHATDRATFSLGYRCALSSSGYWVDVEDWKPIGVKKLNKKWLEK